MKIIYEYWKSITILPPGVEESKRVAYVEINDELYEIKTTKIFRKPSSKESGYVLIKIPKVDERIN